MSISSRSAWALAALILVFPPLVQAGKVKVWQQNKAAHYEKSQFKHVVVSNEGTLRLSRRVKPLAALEATHLWDLAEDKNGNLFVASGDGGKLWKISADGKATVLHASEDSQVLSLAVASDGTLFAGTGPSGKILKVEPGGQVKTIREVGGYVWSLALDARGENLYAACGPRGKLWKLNREGKGDVLFASKQDHLLCVAVGADGSVYAGSDKDGLVYRIDARGKAFVLFQAPQSEIRTLKVLADGTLYAGTSAPSKRGTTSTVQTGESEPVAQALSRKDTVSVSSRKEVKTSLASSKSVNKDDKDTDKGKGAPAPSIPSAGENSLYRISKDGMAREVFRQKAMVLSLLPLQGRLLVGTGMNGQLFEVDEKSREYTEIARLEHGQILSLIRRADGTVVLGTGDPGKLYVLEDQFASSGTVVSEVFDAKMIARWGSIRWQGQTPAGTRLSVAVRSGNVSRPDETWSDWTQEQTDGDRATVSAPAARFLQYRVTLTSSDGARTPQLRTLAIRYSTANQAPEVTKIEVPDLDVSDLTDPKKLKFKWTAEDANEDVLTYRLYVRKEGWKEWVLLEEDLEKTEYEWDTTATPAGVYQLRVVASDRKDNSEKDALEGSRISVPFVVCHTPPQVTLKVTGLESNQALLEASASSPLVRLTGASFSVNGKKWQPIFPEDELFDSKSETFKFRTDTLKPGTYVVVLKVKDASGNIGSADVVFTVQARK